ncbi:hypothetical protein RHMOL_Rhmol01G0351900 [Rhododendron molle]|uniref:Uncharacterized protein n=1 Tax=Rhododendron molle TaxID=49168 RepID=A0ACC0QCF6_RHOML|nr:hypothetical protein RHMOL_Rhmol01G0351900 [Rhododendron molle]
MPEEKTQSQLPLSSWPGSLQSWLADLTDGHQNSFKRSEHVARRYKITVAQS